MKIQEETMKGMTNVESWGYQLYPKQKIQSHVWKEMEEKLIVPPKTPWVVRLSARVFQGLKGWISSQIKFLKIFIKPIYTSCQNLILLIASVALL